MFSRKIVLLLIVLLLLGSAALPGYAQGGEGGEDTPVNDDACDSVVAAALASVEEHCADLGRGEACYGYARIDASFWPDAATTAFDAPADRAPLRDLQTIATAPTDLDASEWGVALLNVQADLAGALPGAAVQMLLMGDASVESAVSPDEAAVPVEPVAATATASANVRSAPSTNANIVGGTVAGQSVSLVGVNADGDWYQIALEAGGTGWLWGELVDLGGADTSALPVVDPDAPRYAPMQAFTFTADMSGPTCERMPNALVLSTPDDVSVTLAVNELEITIGSTVAVTLTRIGELPALVFALLQGSLSAEINGVQIDIEQPSQTFAREMPVFAVTLNVDGVVDEESILAIPGVSAIESVVENACLNAASYGLPGLYSGVCGAQLQPLNASGAPAGEVEEAGDPTAAMDALAGIAPDAPCQAAAAGAINLREGPSTGFAAAGQLADGEIATPDAQALAADGYTWLRLTSGAWVRGDLVVTAGACDALPTVEAPTPPPFVVSDGQGSTDVNGIWHSQFPGGGWCDPGAGPRTIRLVTAAGCFLTMGDLEAQAPQITFTVTVDGVPAPTLVWNPAVVEPYTMAEIDLCPEGVVGQTLYRTGWQATSAMTLAPGEHVLVFNETGPRGFHTLTCTYTAR